MLFLLTILSCTADDASSNPDSASQDTDDTAQEVWTAHPGGVIELIAEDGGVLAGDFYPSNSENQPTLLLYGEYWDVRETVSATFVEGAVSVGWNVLVMDWRGHGGSADADVDYAN